MQKRHIPGLSLAIVKDGKVIKMRGYGLASVEHNVPATEDTIYGLGSVTKSFTATAIMLLVEEGKVRLDDKISQYLDGLPASWSEITVRRLLSHTAGLLRDATIWKRETVTKFYPRDEFLKIV